MIKCFHCNMLDENCYVVSDDATKECVIIDCGALYEQDFNAIFRYIDSNGLKPVHLLATHGHLDHNFGNAAVCERYNLQVEAAAADRSLLSNPEIQAAQFFGMRSAIPAAPIGPSVSHNAEIKYGTQTLRAIATPGHTQGGVVYYNKEEKTAFTGDTLFNMSIGRTDLEGGSFEALLSSLRLLVETLPEDTKIYPGHGPASDMKTELQFNTYLSF